VSVFYADGETYSPEFDYHRLNAQMKKVFDLMQDGGWRTLHEISERTGASEASVSARLRDFRKARFGCLNVYRRRIGKGLWEYSVAPSGKLF
jgi:hypothetical protein